MKCPACGRKLRVVSFPDTPPYLCASCHRGFWKAEATPEAAKLWRNVEQDFGFMSLIRDAVEDERCQSPS